MAYKAKRRKEPERGRPSIFFIIALLLGLILLVWAFIALAGKPPKPTTFGLLSPESASIRC